MSNELGFVNIKTALINNGSGGKTLDIKNLVMSVSIYESIFTPGTLCDVKILDSFGYLEEMKLVGGEHFLISFNSENSPDASYEFIINTLENLTQVGSQKGKIYILKCVNREVMKAHGITLGIIPRKTCGEMIKEIHTKYLDSNKKIDIEPTKGTQLIEITNVNPFSAIKRIRTASISQDNKSSLYVYYECREDGETIFRYRTIESLFKNKPIKTFKQSDANAKTLLNSTSDNILAYRVEQQFSAIDKARLGSLVSHVNVFENNQQAYEDKSINPGDNFKDGGRGTSIRTSFKQEFGSEKNPPQDLFYQDLSRPRTFISDTQPYRKAYIALMLQNVMTIRVPGDTILSAGQIVECKIPQKTANEKYVDDPLMSGKFLITRVHHRIAEAGEPCRYSCVLELVKGKFNESV